MKLKDLSREELIALWIEQGKTDRDIAAMCDTTAKAVKARRRELDVFLGCGDRSLSLAELPTLRRAIDREIEKRLKSEQNRPKKQDD